ncbi:MULTISPECIES: DUF3054 domain-containing protein [unclassified Arthrobacter]|uniref:DUF3054 domain-containing protein n=1 Tax=unclassified Arthrobacter TaxID=235627 RepID=UPI001D14792E|nr:MULTISPECIES: DUF3054 domain-containing protein [unclassified Arthrobacter]MCC3274803.1 DUF3054 domain-containing protein [Arthrobacter sp. zg-Y20]MCC3279227.1 DUF3054 domain-containing protein [Arthrobacter sp. zg-Y40]MCC9177603.1 DUF3054 domain-containing protein [Arthrobacter sp. zg-Y750]MDK1314959.1 DUF3054 domain-containing protein [Arthrobacter sp. zg.Y20]MDK1327821.1 DUF3054 domain-containing protein [Arthrobacter sp. zg-Y1143]
MSNTAPHTSGGNAAAANSAGTSTEKTIRSWPLVLAADLVLIVVFAALGRRSHEHGLALAGILGTALPFAAACLLGWAAARAWRRPVALWPSGVVIWLVTVVAGLGIRALTGGGTATSFMLVTLAVLAVFLLGQRLLWRAGARVRSRRIH